MYNIHCISYIIYITATLTYTYTSYMYMYIIYITATIINDLDTPAAEEARCNRLGSRRMDHRNIRHQVVQRTIEARRDIRNKAYDRRRERVAPRRRCRSGVDGGGDADRREGRYARTGYRNNGQPTRGLGVNRSSDRLASR